MSTHDFDVVVFGGGMVGAAAALGFAEQGYKIAIVEPVLPKEIEPDAEPELRVSAISLGSEQLLKELGAWQYLLNQRVQAYKQLSVWEMPQAKTQFDCEQVQVSWLGHIMENLNLQLALHKALKRFETQLTWFTCGEVIDAELGLCNLDGKQHSTSLVVAADGGFSAVRRSVELGETGWQYQQKVLSVNIRTHERSLAHTFQQFSESGPMAYLPLFDHFATLVWYHDANRVDELMKLNKSQLKAQLLSSFPALHSDFEILQQGCFPIRRNHANQYYKGRVVLCGDAAHNINPLAGQGVNIGFQDVKALLQVNPNLALQSQLAGYEKARRKENTFMMSAMDAFNLAFCDSNPILKGIRNVGLFLAERSGPLKTIALKRALGVDKI
ncbi:FAD-dependent monooxygenase [Planctobacterium marinum]|uniref:2-octaprenyl-3-methyl-6-methoxy-1,4-benzoquinol hydroxylase n=1 Tax=Planctobacterium marinum TaxID=1631968 RepID=A0AA48KSA1_9ALTE|nr:2-octaprenyl-3-methyl-6-methoxy-1,4-benzoquinol hydroxylase [Planctobacterium marinum]